MKRINDLIVVEGKMDVAFLGSFLDADFYTVNGSAVNDKDVNFLKEVKKNRDIIVLTDPDFPGKKIRDYLNEHIEGLKNAYVRKEVSIKHHKVGVAESTKEEILKALDNLVTYTNNPEVFITQDEFFDLGLNGKEDSRAKRKIICDKLQIEECNAKRLLFMLNLMHINKEKVEELLNVNS